jgi:feruloyl esterase
MLAADGRTTAASSSGEQSRSQRAIWEYAAFNRSPINITAAQATAVTAAVVKRCAGKDGGPSSDNFLTDPRDCHWDPAALQCTGGAADAATCLTAPQVAAMRKFYEGPVNPRTGERIYAGQVRGSESNSGYPARIPAAPTNVNSPYWAFGNDFDPLTFDFDHDMDALDDAMAARLKANTADLEEFRSHGGKLILVHGFADPRVPTLNTVAYYERLIAGQTRDSRHDEGERKEGLRRAQEFARLFLVPGAGHCGGGAGPDIHPHLDELVQWVEHGIAPGQMIVSKVVNGVTAFTRPLCPYPARARYTGVGDPTMATNFMCVDDSDRDDNQPSARKYLNDRHNYPIVPIDDHPPDDGDDKR